MTSEVLIKSLRQEAARSAVKNNNQARLPDDTVSPCDMPQWEAADLIESQAAEIERLKAGYASIISDVETSWRFDEKQQHTHTWHDRADCLERIKLAAERAAEGEE